MVMDLSGPGRALLTLSTADGECPAVLSKPSSAGPGPWPGVILFMDALGWRPRIAEVADRIAATGYAVLAPDLFYRQPLTEPVDLSQGSSELWATLRPRMDGCTSSAAITSDVAAFIAALDADADVRRPFGVTGYCMGGRVALKAAALHPEAIAAAASFHGGGLVGDEPDSPHRLVSRIKATVLVAGARDDQSFTDEHKQTLVAAFAAAGTDAHVDTWPALHGWTMSDHHRSYDEAQTERHYQALDELFGSALAPL